MKEAHLHLLLSFFTLKLNNIMGKGKQVKVKATARRKPKLSSGKGGFLVGRVSTIIKNKKSRNG